jgi:hypothetical protein
VLRDVVGVATNYLLRTTYQDAACNDTPGPLRDHSPTFAWPKVTGTENVTPLTFARSRGRRFPTRDTDQALLKEATRRGYSLYSGGNAKPGNKMFQTLFYKGGRIQYREDVPEEHRNNVYAYLRSFMGSFAPKHEHKHAICAMLLDEIATGTCHSAKPQSRESRSCATSCVRCRGLRTSISTWADGLATVEPTTATDTHTSR